MEGDGVNRALHGLRGVAVLYVLASHIGSNLLPFPHNAIGKVGVWIFFCLSAFLLTDRLRRQLITTPARVAVPQYFVHRVFRIYPLFLVVLLVHFWHGNLTGESALRHAFLLDGWRELWAISVEFQYYLLIPFFALLRPKPASLIIAALAVLALGLGVSSPESVFSNGIALAPKATPFLAASLLGIWVARVKINAAVGLFCVIALLLCTVLYRHIHVTDEWWWVAPWLSAAMGVAVVGIISAVQRPGVLSSILATAPLVWLGKISFSIYLLHMLVLGFVSSYGLPPVLNAWLIALGSVALATVSYGLIERPGIRAGKWLAQAMFRNGSHA